MKYKLITRWILYTDIYNNCINEPILYNCKATWFWVKKSKEYNFLLIMHEHLFVFQKF